MSEFGQFDVLIISEENDSPRESWRVIPLRGLLNVTKHPLLTRAT